jgi:hypothetical protein
MTPQTECISALVELKEEVEAAIKLMNGQNWAPYYHTQVSRHPAILKSVKDLSIQFATAVEALAQAGIDNDINEHLRGNPEMHMHVQLKETISDFWDDAVGDQFEGMEEKAAESLSPRGRVEDAAERAHDARCAA